MRSITVTEPKLENPPQPTTSVDSEKKPSDLPQPLPRVQAKEQPELSATTSKPKVAVEPQQQVVQPQQSSGNDDDSAYDELTVDELISLLQNFTKLDKDSQEQLILYMKKLESTHPEKVAFIRRNLQ